MVKSHILTLLSAGYVNSIYGYLPFLALLFLLLLSFLSLIHFKKRIRFDMEADDSVCQRGEMVNVVAKIRNDSVFICPKIGLSLYASDFFGEEDMVITKKFAMQGRSESEFPVPLKMKHIGVYTWGIKELRIYDMLGIFSITIGKGRDFQVTVLPKTSLSEALRFDEKQLAESQNVQKSVISDGFDYTGVREYALGDSMKRIHWKLSAHSSGYMTKITESSRKTDLLVVIDFVSATYHHSFPYLYDALVETALSFLEQAQGKDIEYALLFAGMDGEIIKVIPKGKQDYQDLIHQIPSISKNKVSNTLDGAELLEKESHASNRSANIILCTSKVTEELMQQLILIRQQQRNPMLCCIVPPDLANAERERLLVQLRVLDDYDILYRLIDAETAQDD